MPAPEYLDPRLTEHRNPRTERIDVASPLEIVDLINGEDATVAAAVHREREAVARAIELTVAAFQGGGRLVYVGAGTSGRRGVRIVMECCEVDREAARAAIEAAGGSAKLAIVMVRKGIAKAEAERLLQQAGGFVRRAVGDPPPVTQARGRRWRAASPWG